LHDEGRGGSVVAAEPFFVFAAGMKYLLCHKWGPPNCIKPPYFFQLTESIMFNMLELYKNRVSNSP